MRFTSVILVLLLSVSLFAADVDFSGTWKFIKDKSEMPDFGGGPGGGRGFTPPDMVVTQKGDKVTVSRTFTGRDGEERKMEDVYDLSGKVTKSEGPRGGKTENTAKMKDGIMNVETVRVVERDGQQMEMTSTATWQLVDDGKGLVVETVRNTPMGEMKSKAYYEKQ